MVAEKAEIEVVIGTDGEVRIVTHGLKGQACLAETKDLENSLGTVTEREKTREFYMQEEKAGTSVRRR